MSVMTTVLISLAIVAGLGFLLHSSAELIDKLVLHRRTKQLKKVRRQMNSERDHSGDNQRWLSQQKFEPKPLHHHVEVKEIEFPYPRAGNHE